MTDQTPADLADKVRKLAARFRQQMEPHISVAECVVWERAAEAVEALLPPPPLPTLADMTMDERDECQWMQADTKLWGRVVIIVPDLSDGRAALLDRSGDVIYGRYVNVTPRPDLPRMKWPGTEKPAPVPALPDGWQLADHQKYGRVMVTTQTPGSDENVFFVLPSDGPLGYDWFFCTPAELTYIDGPESPAPARVGDTIESADDPRIDSLPAGSILCDLDGDDMEKTATGEWRDVDGITIESPGCGPWTVHRIGNGADQ